MISVFKRTENEPLHRHEHDISEGDEGIDDEIV